MIAVLPKTYIYIQDLHQIPLLEIFVFEVSDMVISVVRSNSTPAGVFISLYQCLYQLLSSEAIT